MKIPNVLCLSGHDPSGGAGLQADIEAIAAQGCHAASVITALTRQDTKNAYAVSPIAEDEFAAQLDILFEDMQFSAIKLGLLGSVAQIRHITRICRQNAHIPLVLDPVLKAGGGAQLAQDPVAFALDQDLIPLATVITPNAAEARRLCPQHSDLDSCGQMLAQRARWVLITGGDEGNADVINRLYGPDGHTQSYTWPRLPHHYHGSGCTLASAIAACLAQGLSPQSAIQRGQEYTWECLQQGFKPGQGQYVPNRLQHDRT